MVVKANKAEDGEEDLVLCLEDDKPAVQSTSKQNLRRRGSSGSDDEYDDEEHESDLKKTAEEPVVPTKLTADDAVVAAEFADVGGLEYITDEYESRIDKATRELVESIEAINLEAEEKHQEDKEEFIRSLEAKQKKFIEDFVSQLQRLHQRPLSTRAAGELAERCRAHAGDLRAAVGLRGAAERRALAAAHREVAERVQEGFDAALEEHAARRRRHFAWLKGRFAERLATHRAAAKREVEDTLMLDRTLLRETKRDLVERHTKELAALKAGFAQEREAWTAREQDLEVRLRVSKSAWETKDAECQKAKADLEQYEAGLPEFLLGAATPSAPGSPRAAGLPPGLFVTQGGGGGGLALGPGGFPVSRGQQRAHRADITVHKAFIKMLRGHVVRLEGELLDTAQDRDALQQRLGLLEGLVPNMKAELAKLAAMLAESNKEVLAAKKAAREILRERQALVGEVERLEGEKAELLGQLKRQRKDVQALERLRGREKELENLRAELKGLKDGRGDLQEQIDWYKDLLDQANDRISVMEDEVREKVGIEEQAQALQKIMNDLIAEIADLRREADDQAAQVYNLETALEYEKEQRRAARAEAQRAQEETQRLAAARFNKSGLSMSGGTSPSWTTANTTPNRSRAPSAAQDAEGEKGSPQQPAKKPGKRRRARPGSGGGGGGGGNAAEKEEEEEEEEEEDRSVATKGSEASLDPAERARRREQRRAMEEAKRRADELRREFQLRPDRTPRSRSNLGHEGGDGAKTWPGTRARSSASSRPPSARPQGSLEEMANKAAASKGAFGGRRQRDMTGLTEAEQEELAQEINEVHYERAGGGTAQTTARLSPIEGSAAGTAAGTVATLEDGTVATLEGVGEKEEEGGGGGGGEGAAAAAKRAAAPTPTSKFKEETAAERMAREATEALNAKLGKAMERRQSTRGGPSPEQTAELNRLVQLKIDPPGGGGGGGGGRGGKEEEGHRSPRASLVSQSTGAPPSHAAPTLNPPAPPGSPGHGHQPPSHAAAAAAAARGREVPPREERESVDVFEATPSAAIGIPEGGGEGGGAGGRPRGAPPPAVPGLLPPGLGHPHQSAASSRRATRSPSRGVEAALALQRQISDRSARSTVSRQMTAESMQSSRGTSRHMSSNISNAQQAMVFERLVRVQKERQEEVATLTLMLQEKELLLAELARRVRGLKEENFALREQRHYPGRGPRRHPQLPGGGGGNAPHRRAMTASAPLLAPMAMTSPAKLPLGRGGGGGSSSSRAQTAQQQPESLSPAPISSPVDQLKSQMRKGFVEDKKRIVLSNSTAASGLVKAKKKSRGSLGASGGMGMVPAAAPSMKLKKGLRNQLSASNLGPI